MENQSTNCFQPGNNSRCVESDLWETPPEVFKPLNDEFHFDWDVCATAETTKCPGRYFSPEQDGLKQDWKSVGNVFWMNPPYSKEGKKDAWVRKAYYESKKGSTVVCLLPAKTDTKCFHEFIYRKPNVELRFLEGRIRFLMNGVRKSVGRSPSMVVIFRPEVENARV